MTITSLIGILAVLISHWVSDFVLQTDKQALNKSTSNLWLLGHVATYTASMTSLMALYSAHGLQNWHTWAQLGAFASITFVSHFVTDYITSRINAKLWKEDKRHAFFMCVGFDQLLHYLQLFLTIKLLI